MDGERTLTSVTLVHFCLQFWNPDFKKTSGCVQRNCVLCLFDKVLFLLLLDEYFFYMSVRIIDFIVKCQSQMKYLKCDTVVSHNNIKHILHHTDLSLFQVLFIWVSFSYNFKKFGQFGQLILMIKKHYAEYFVCDLSNYIHKKSFNLYQVK